MSEHRLTDAELEEAFGYTNSLRITAALSELKERRAADLTAEEREALAEIRRCVQPTDYGMPGMVSPAALALLDRILATKGGAG